MHDCGVPPYHLLDLLELGTSASPPPQLAHDSQRGAEVRSQNTDSACGAV
jgi:hypothetical protein